MLVFVDESGDSGFKLDRGSSTHFVVAAVCFSDRSEADACDAAIGEYRRNAGLSDRFEFHFSQTRDDITFRLLQTVTTFDFIYAACFVDKTLIGCDPGRSPDDDLLADLSESALRLLPDLAEAIVVVDGEKPKTLQSQFEKRLKEVNRERGLRAVRKVKFRRSQGNNLVQLADAVSGAVFRSITKNDDTLRNVIRRHERAVERRL